MEKSALITGASRGIGKACALELAKRGYDIAINYVSNDQLAEETAGEIRALGRKAEIYKADTTDLAAVKNMFRQMVKDFGKIDVLVNNAGVVDDAYLLMVKEESLDKSLDINIKGYFNCAQQAALKMLSKKSGRIINISSVSSVIALAGQSVYSATKGAVNSMTRVMAKELSPKGITVNAVAPGFVSTEMIDHIPEDMRDEYLKSIPAGRFATAADVANVVAALCSDDFSYVTGQVIILDGGLSL